MHVRNFDEQNFDKLIVAFIGKVLTGKIERENFDKSLAVCQNLSDFSIPPSKFGTIRYLQLAFFNRLHPIFINYIIIYVYACMHSFIIYMWLQNNDFVHER